MSCAIEALFLGSGLAVKLQEVVTGGHADWVGEPESLQTPHPQESHHPSVRRIAVLPPDAFAGAESTQRSLATVPELLLGLQKNGLGLRSDR